MASKPEFDRRYESRKGELTYKSVHLLFVITGQLAKAMNEQGSSISKLADHLKISKSVVSRLLNGRTNFTLKTWAKLAHALKVDIEVSHHPIDHQSLEMPAILAAMPGQTDAASHPNVGQHRLRPVPTADELHYPGATGGTYLSSALGTLISTNVSSEYVSAQ